MKDDPNFKVYSFNRLTGSLILLDDWISAVLSDTDKGSVPGRLFYTLKSEDLNHVLVVDDKKSLILSVPLKDAPFGEKEIEIYGHVSVQVQSEWNSYQYSDLAFKEVKHVPASSFINHYSYIFESEAFCKESGCKDILQLPSNFDAIKAAAFDRTVYGKNVMMIYNLMRRVPEIFIDTPKHQSDFFSIVELTSDFYFGHPVYVHVIFGVGRGRLSGTPWAEKVRWATSQKLLTTSSSFQLKPMQKALLDATRGFLPFQLLPTRMVIPCIIFMRTKSV